MARIVRLVKNNLLRRPVLLGRGVSLAAGAGIASILSFQAEAELGKPKDSLQLENIEQKWSHKYLLQQSRLDMLKNPKSSQIIALNG